MGIKDDYQFDYLDDNDRFADQINGALFKGKQIVKAEELEAADSQIVNTVKEEAAGNMEGRRGKKSSGSIKTIVDKVRTWHGRKVHILVIENQNYVDYQMVLRNMLSESNGYHKQWKQKKSLHAKSVDLRDGDEYMSGISKEEKFAPIITLVVYFGIDHPWDGAKCLYELLDIDDELKVFVTNYKLNLYDCQEHDTFDEYRTGLRQVFESVRYSKDKNKLKSVMEENREAYSKIDSNTKDMLEVIANIKIPEKFKTIEGGKERYDMCKAFEDMRQEGYEEGLEKGIEREIRILIQSYQELDISRDVIVQKCAEKYEIALESAERYVEEYCV